MFVESCVNCALSERDSDGALYCNDPDGLYFNSLRKETQHCPDYERKFEVINTIIVEEDVV